MKQIGKDSLYILDGKKGCNFWKIMGGNNFLVEKVNAIMYEVF
jgi:hypothetical protein